jgi:signal transduction histidine kinase
VSRSEDGALVPHPSEFELPALLGEVSSEMARRIEDKDQRLEVAIAPDVRVMTADRDLVRRIVENLVDNAYKYGPRRATIKIEVGLPARADGAAPDVVELRVRDEGESIPAAFRQKIFEKYARVEGRSAHEVRHSHGLGLVFCRRAVEIHGGQIWVEENPGRGNCFCVRLALRPGAPASLGARGETGVAGGAPAAATAAPL